MPGWRDRMKQMQTAAERGAKQAAEKAQEARERAEPRLRDAAARAKPVVEEKARKGRAAVDAKLDERKARQEARETWFQTEPGPVYTAGYADRETMRAGIQAAAEHGWRVETTATVPEKRRFLGGLTVSVAKQAADRVLKPDRFLVTFRTGGAAPPATPEAGDPESPADEPPRAPDA